MSVLCDLQYVSGFDKIAPLSLFVDFELTVLGGSTVDELFVALRCASIAAPVPKIRSLKVRKCARCNYEKTAHNLFVITCIRKHGNGVTILPALKRRKGLQVSNLARMLGQYHRYERHNNPNFPKTSFRCIFCL